MATDHILTHTHTHIYIYIYAYNICIRASADPEHFACDAAKTYRGHTNTHTPCIITDLCLLVSWTARSGNIGSRRHETVFTCLRRVARMCATHVHVLDSGPKSEQPCPCSSFPSLASQPLVDALPCAMEDTCRCEGQASRSGCRLQSLALTTGTPPDFSTSSKEHTTWRSRQCPHSNHLWLTL